jgi:biopolymer transport protein ExbD
MMARTHVAPQAESTPIAAINTTPLIDMMLVILIMLIVSIPMTTHKVPLDLPAPHSVPQTPPPVHRLVILTSGALSWDGQALPAAALAARLQAFEADPVHPVLELEPEGAARYERVDEVLAAIRRAGVTRLGFVGNERFAAGLDAQAAPAAPASAP